MDEKDFSIVMRKTQKERWLKLADSLCNSGNKFFEQFSSFIKEGYKDAERSNYVFNEPAWATKQQTVLKEMLDFEAFRLPPMQAKGCALIGKSDFDKLEFIKRYFGVCGLIESTRKETSGRYTVIDCSKIKGYAGMIKAFIKNQDAAYIVFNNCDSLLKHDWALQAVKQLSEYFPGITIVTKEDECINFKTELSFVFLCEENPLHAAVEKEIKKGLGASAYDHFDAFLHYIHVYDFDKGEQYYGHDVPSVYN